MDNILYLVIEEDGWEDRILSICSSFTKAKEMGIKIRKERWGNRKRPWCEALCIKKIKANTIFKDYKERKGEVVMYFD